jgi:NitT/TauT family transport system ATP-binding protein
MQSRPDWGLTRRVPTASPTRWTVRDSLGHACPAASGWGRNLKTRIVVDRVCHDFGHRPVLDTISLEVAAHELVCVVGQSGCGKTTLLRVIAGLLEPDAGTVRLDGEVVDGPSPRMAMVFQHFGLFPWKSVRANIAYGLANRGRRDPDRVEALMRTMGLADVGDRYPRQLSGGMRQRVGLARALAVEPEVLLMDEPFGSLDAITREQLQDELLRIWERDPAVTGVFVTHDIDEAILLGDRIVALRPHPGRVSRQIEVPIPRPRTALGVRADPAYPALRAELWRALLGEPEAVA